MSNPVSTSTGRVHTQAFTSTASSRLTNGLVSSSTGRLHTRTSTSTDSFRMTCVILRARMREIYAQFIVHKKHRRSRVILRAVECDLLNTCTCGSKTELLQKPVGLGYAIAGDGR